MNELKTYATEKKLTAVLKVIAAECLDDLPTSVIDRAVRQLERVIDASPSRRISVRPSKCSSGSAANPLRPAAHLTRCLPMNQTIQTVPLNSPHPMLASGRIVLIAGALDRRA